MVILIDNGRQIQLANWNGVEYNRPYNNYSAKGRPKVLILRSYRRY